MIVEFVTCGGVDKELIELIAEKVAEVFGASYRLASPLLPPPQNGYDPHRRQYDVGALIAELRRSRTLPGPCVLGIADMDLHALGLNSVFGQADLTGRTAVISLTRLRPQFWAELPDSRFLPERSVKEAVPELGHTIGLRHCANPHCVMHFPETLADTDCKTERLCLGCVGMLPRNSRIPAIACWQLLWEHTDRMVCYSQGIYQ